MSNIPPSDTSAGAAGAGNATIHAAWRRQQEKAAKVAALLEAEYTALRKIPQYEGKDVPGVGSSGGRKAKKNEAAAAPQLV